MTCDFTIHHAPPSSLLIRATVTIYLSDQVWLNGTAIERAHNSATQFVVVLPSDLAGDLHELRAAILARYQEELEHETSL